MGRPLCSSRLTAWRKPSLSRIFASANFICERGMVTVSAFTMAALRMRVSMSEIGSVIIGLPASFPNARDFSDVCKFTETDAAQAEVTHEETLSSTAPAAEHMARHELWRLV